MYDSTKDHWSKLPVLPCRGFCLVTVPERKQLLAIGGITFVMLFWQKVVDKVFLWDEKSQKWLTSYPDMPTARCYPSCISNGSSVIVAGGIVDYNPRTITKSVEVLHISDTDSHWSVVEQLPHLKYGAVSLIVNDNLYIAGGFDENRQRMYTVATASLPQLLQSSNNETSSDQVWNKLPDMPYSSFSINHYQGHLISFNGVEKVEQGTRWRLVPQIHIYNIKNNSWDCVGENTFDYYFGLSVHAKENKILFVGGLTGEYQAGKHDNLITSCMLLTLTPQ